MKNKYLVLSNKLSKKLARNQVIIAKYHSCPNSPFFFAAKNRIGVIRYFDDTCFKLAIKFSNGYSTEDKY